MALLGTSAADELEVTRRQQTDLIAGLMGVYLDTPDPVRIQVSAEFVVGGCERLAIWCEQDDSLTPEVATEHAMRVLWHGLEHLTQQ